MHSNISVLNTDRRKREETLRYILRIDNKKFQSVYKLRTYTSGQFLDLLKKARCFAIMSVHDLEYDLNKTIQINQKSEDIVCILNKT